MWTPHPRIQTIHHQAETLEENSQILENMGRNVDVLTQKGIIFYHGHKIFFRVQESLLAGKGRNIRRGRFLQHK
jgi:hypothetical protein